jgi:methionyl-tRNA synthetase
MMTISFDDFARLEIRIGTVRSVEKVADADKLLRFVFDVGEVGERQIMAGMAPFFPNPGTLVGRQFPLLLNIEAREFRGYLSQGMIIAADVDHKPVFLNPEREVPSGTLVK